MDAICKEIGVPRKQIRDTEHSERFSVVTNRSWLIQLKQKKITRFSVHPGFDEWPSENGSDLGPDWCLTYFITYKKSSQNVVPVESKIKTTNEIETLLNLSQLMQYISSSNYRKLWKDAYYKYSLQQDKLSSYECYNKSDSINLVPHDRALLESLMRIYGRNIVYIKSEQLKCAESDCDTSTVNDICFDAHMNLYPLAAVIELDSYFLLIHDAYIEHNLKSCIAYSPAILSSSHNKPLFLIYQLVQLMKSLHDRGALLGDIGLGDIFFTENFWLQIIPRLDSNNLLLSDNEDYVMSTTDDLDRNNLQRIIKLPTIHSLSYSLKDYAEMWCNGKISNFEYLTILNNVAGRRIGDPEFHHIMPWVTDFTSRNGMNWRDLTKSKYRLTKGDVQLDLTFVPSGDTTNMKPHHVSEVLSEITYYVYTARRTSKAVLCKHVRPNFVAAEYPASISRIYDWTPDECIPEFYFDPLIFKSIHEDLPDLEVPQWSSCPEDFISRHREALESQYVSERLHHWIDLNFGYKLTGKAAVKAKNVYLSIVDEHQSLRKHGMVQIFSSSHPAKLYQTTWTSKSPPRMLTRNEVRQRLSRSTEDLSRRRHSNFNSREDHVTTQNSSKSPKSRISSGSEDSTNNIERSTSLKFSNQIFLPKDFNPIAALSTIENMESFFAKTFSSHLNEHAIATNASNSLSNLSLQEEGVNAFTNKFFTECYEEKIIKDNKHLHNLNHKNAIVRMSARNIKRMMSDIRHRELRVIACLIVEIFLAHKMRPISNGGRPTFEQRMMACKNVVRANLELLPKCVRHIVLQLLPIECDESESILNDIGLSRPSATQLLQPLLSNLLLPFPRDYLRAYVLLKSLEQFNQISRHLDSMTYFDLSNSECSAYKEIESSQIDFKRKIAECKVMTFAAQFEGFLKPGGYEQFKMVDLILPHFIDLLQNDDTSILAAWNLFDNIATLLGPIDAQKYLLEPILKLYDSEGDDRRNVPRSNWNEVTTKSNPSSTFKSMKAIKLYHHSFLLRLIVRFGMKCFLVNFVPPLIEAIGGYKEPVRTAGAYQFVDRNDLSKNESSFGSCKDEKDCMFALDADDEQKNSSEDVDKESVNSSDSKENSPLSIRFNTSTSTQRSGPTSPTIAIPSKTDKFNTIDCEVGSRQEESMKSNNNTDSSRTEQTDRQSNHYEKQCTISKMAMENTIWLSHRLGPVLTARYLTRNLLKMLTLCYVGQENLLPNTGDENRQPENEGNLIFFSVAEGIVDGDYHAVDVLECLKSITAIFGDHFILLQYLPHITELIAQCKRRITPTLEGGLTGSLQFLKCLIPCLSDSVIMDQMHDTILKNIIHPVIRLIASTGSIMPNGFLTRNVCARKLLDLIYVLAVRIGPEMTKEYLCVPALQRFFLIFDKAYGIHDNLVTETSTNERKEESNFIEIRRDGKIKEWSMVKGPAIQIMHAKDHNECVDNITPPKTDAISPSTGIPSAQRDKILEEIRDVFTPQLAHTAYVTFLKYLGETVMEQVVKNLVLILNLCHEHQQPNDASIGDNRNIATEMFRKENHLTIDGSTFAHGEFSNSFGTPVIGNRIEVNDIAGERGEIGPMELLDLITYKYDEISTSRHLHGNWSAYWEHEIGRSEKSNHFNFKQIKLQSFAGHTSAVRSLLTLDNENSFISSSKDKTVKLWSLRSEGDGSKVSSCQFTYANHRKSVYSLTFLESLRLVISCDSGIHIWDPFVGGDIGQLESTHKITPISIVKAYPAPSSLILAGTGDATVKTIDARTLSYVNEWKLGVNSNANVRCLAIAPSGNWIAVGLSTGQIFLCDGRTGIIRNYWKATDSELLQLAAVNEDQIISTSLDHSIAIWSSLDGTSIHYMKNPNEPIHCLTCDSNELIFGTPVNRIGVFPSISPDATYSITKLRSETLKGILTSFALLPLNRMILTGSDQGNISLLC